MPQPTSRPFFSSLFLILLAVGALCGSVRTSFAQEPAGEESSSPAVVPTALREALMRKDFDAAVRSLNSLIAERPEEGDFWTYLTAIAQQDAGERAAAVKTLEGFDERFPASDWIEKAKYRLADLYWQLGDYERAEGIYEEGIKRLRSPERQGELADIYLRFADELSIAPEGVRPESAPLDYDRARALYEKVLELDAPRADRGKALFRAAICQQELQRWNEAAAAFVRYLDDFDPMRSAERPTFGGAGAHVFDAHLRMGNATRSAGNLAGARRSYEDLVRGIARARRGEGPWSSMLEDADTERVRAIEGIAGAAAYSISLTWPADASSQAVLGIAALERFVEAHPDHPRAPRAAYEIAQRFGALGRDEDALAAYDSFLERPARTDVQEVREEDARLKQEALFQKAGLLQAQQRFAQAITTFEEYVGRHPTGSDWSAAQQGIVESEYSVGAAHRSRHEYEAARVAWRAFLEQHPLDGRAANLVFLIGELYAEEGEWLLQGDADDGARARPLFEESIAQWARVVTKYAGSDQASHALFRTGSLRENRLDDLEGAIEAYRRCNFGAYSSPARARLAAMTEASLTIFTERTWRTDEAARVNVQIRNVEELTVQVYELDLEAYFRKHLTYQNIEGLDLDLIAADIELELPVTDYARYEPIEQTVELPVEGPGVWAVVVRGDDLRATTLVLRSDIDVIVKSSRRELFVYAQDMLRDTPAPGVEVLVAALRADGPAMYTLQTGDDGIARLSFDELSTVDELRVLALREGNYASNGLSISGLGTARGLEPRGFVYTDRSAYRPGDAVQWRAILRDIGGGSYTFEPGQEWFVEVVDSQGRSFWKDRLELSDLGTLSASLQLDALAPTGNYSIRCLTPNGPTFSGGFTVAEYQLRKIELQLETEREVYFRGERIEVEAIASYYYGEPVADSPLRVQLPDGRVLDLRTDAAGRASFALDTAEFTDERALRFQATLIEEQVNANANVWLAQRGFGIAVTSGREVYLAGDAFDVMLRATAPDGGPLERALTLEVLRRESPDRGTWAEVLVETHELLTDAETGAASRSISIERGGLYILRGQGSDRFGNPIFAQRMVRISGDDDDVKLRLFAESSALRVGQEVALDLHDRAGAGLALVTFEGEEILEYRIVRLTEGSNRIAFEVGAELFPNFVVSAAMMLGNEFFTASSEFQVSRKLIVELTPARDVVAPGEETGLRVRTTDQNGNPVQAEVSVAIVDAALFDLFPDRTPALRAYFEQGARREAAMRTATSCAFRYQGVTREIAQAILDEAQVVLEAAAWKERRAQAIDSLVVAGEDRRARESVITGSLRYSVGTAEEDFAFDDKAFNDVVGIGGGAGGRFGGRRSQSAHGGEMAEAALDSPLADTALWVPAVRTDENGEATLTFELPDRSTRWRIVSRGVAPGTLLGAAEAGVVSRTPLFVELRAPMELTQGDRPRFMGRVHNLTGARGKAQVKLRVEMDGEQRTIPIEVLLGDEPTVEVLFPELEKIPDVGSLRLELEVSAELGGRTLHDRIAREIDVRPWGVEYFATASGLLNASRTVWLELPDHGEYRRRQLDVFIGPSVGGMLIRAALGSNPHFRRPGTQTNADTAGDLIGVTSVMELLSRSRRIENPEYAALQRRAAELVARLVAAQNDGGGWSWTGRKGGEHAETTCRALVAITRARELGIHVPPVTQEKAIQSLRGAFRGAAQGADELKAMLVHALSVAGSDDFAAANRLHRLRDGLSPAALAYTARALAEMQREPMAQDVARLLAERAVLDPVDDGLVACRWPVERNLVSNRSRVEMIALAALALQEAELATPRVEEATRSLMKSRPWRPPSAAGLAIEALALWRGETRPSTSRSLIAVTTPDGERYELPLSGESAATPLRVPIDASIGRRVRVDLEVAGRTDAHWSMALSGFSTQLEETEGERLKVSTQALIASAPRFRGRTMDTGFDVLRSRGGRWENEITQLPFGATATGSVRFSVFGEDNSTVDRDFLTMEIPLPAGARVLDGSVKGNFSSYEVMDGSIEVRIGRRSGRIGRIQYTLLGVLPGEYRALPVILRNAFEPSEMAISAPAELAVLERGASSSDEYRPTPDELYYLGKARYDVGELGAAWDELQRLVIEWGSDLRDEPLRESARMLLFLAIERSDAPSIVRYFEVLKEKDPDFVVPFEEVLAIGEAYAELEEYERALLIFRATIDETFGADLRVADALSEQDEFLGAMQTIERLWLEFPDLPSVVESYLALADEYLAKAPKAGSDRALRRAGKDRAALIFDGILTLRRFLALYGSDPLAPEAGLNLVSAHLDLEDYDTASILAGQMAELYVEPDFRDAFIYTRAVAEWYSGHVDEAIALLRGIADAVYVDEIGRKRNSQNRELALYILGQIYHARQDVARAAEYYERIEQDFSDARAALASFRRKVIELEEITTARPGEPVPLTLTYRNLGEAELLVYPVDLMTLYLRERDLSRITQVNLSGISPAIRLTVPLGEGVDLRNVEKEILLELPEPGAYLVICRGDDLFASGLALVTDVELEVKDDARAGRVRVQVFEEQSGKYVSDVDVRVVGSAGGAFVSGETDLRGLFVADGVQGAATVIARLDGNRYAFHRGATAMVEREGLFSDGDALPEMLDQNAYFRNVRTLNEDNRGFRQERRKNLSNKQSGGVQVKRVE